MKQINKLHFLAPFMLAAGLTGALAQDKDPFAPEAIDREIQNVCLDEALKEVKDDETPMPATDCIGKAAEACMERTEGGFSTAGMMSCNARESKIWDEQLNANYQRLRGHLDEGAAAQLKKTQLAWIEFRDADCSMSYEIFRGGSIARIIGSACVLDRTAHRSLDLAQYIDMIDAS